MHDIRRIFQMCIAAAVPAVLSFAVAAQEAEPAKKAADQSDRYVERDPNSFHIPHRLITRKDYVDFVRPAAQVIINNPNQGKYGPRHSLPALAVYALEGDEKIGNAIKKTLHHYFDWVKQSIEKDGVVVESSEGTYLSAMIFAEFRKKNFMTEEDEKFARDLILTMRKYHHTWGTGDGQFRFRGMGHRGQAYAANYAIAAYYYPDEPDAPKWKKFADEAWSDWWNFRDIGTNDVNYFYTTLQRVLCNALLTGKTDIFKDPEALRLIWERQIFETSSAGALVPYSAHGGYNSMAGTRIFALEVIAKYTGDGRYRWAAHHLFSFGAKRGFSKNQGHYHNQSIENISLASLVCDDSIEPVQPDANSKLLMRKEVLRLSSKRIRELFPDTDGLDSDLLMTNKLIPSKLAMRSGWDSGDMFMLVECYTRHDPLNPTAILSLERHATAFVEPVYEKFIPRENAMRIDDLSGDAIYLGRRWPIEYSQLKKRNVTDPCGDTHEWPPDKRPLPTGYEGMSCEVAAFSDHKTATHARLIVPNYMGYKVTNQREFLFVKNRFVLVRDEPRFNDRFRARVGPIWSTQNVGDVRGENWVNTWWKEHIFIDAVVSDPPPWDLLVYHFPRKDRKLLVPKSEFTVRESGSLISTRYIWEGDVEPGMRLQFAQILMPHAPTRDATALAESITVLKDELGRLAVIIKQGNRRELAILNPTGRMMYLECELGRILTDGRAVYLDFDGDKAKRLLVIDGKSLTVGKKELFRSAERKDFEQVE